MELILNYLKEAEDGLTDVYRRIAAFPHLPTEDIQRDIANIVVLLYGLRRNGSAEIGLLNDLPHPLVFATQIADRLAMRAGAD